MHYPIPLTLFVIGLTLFIIFYFVSSHLYFKRHQTKYQFFRMLPYEFNYPNVFKNNLYGNLLLIVACIAIMAFYEFSNFFGIYSYVMIVLSILQTMIIILLILVPLRYLRTHIAISVISMVIAMAIPAFNFLIAFQEMKTAINATIKTISIISMVISGVLTISAMINVLNPKMTFKIYANKRIDEDGNEILERPKIIYVALGEWWSIFLHFVSPIAILLLLFFI